MTRAPGKFSTCRHRLVWLVLLVGVAWRLTRYLLCFPIWGDEAMLLVNYLGRGFLDMAGPLEHCQVAPLLFHWAELLVLRVLGSGELAVRLPALLGSLGSLVLFARLARLMLSPAARGLAVALLAVSIWPATLGSLVKPYTFDLFFSLALLLPAVSWQRRPDRLAPLVWLVLVAPVAVLASYPAVLVAGAVSLAGLRLVWRTQPRSASEGMSFCRLRLSGLRVCTPSLPLFLLYNALLIGTFAAHYLLVARAQLTSPVGGSTTTREMAAYWQHGFPPAEPIALAGWLVLAHTGQTVAYPLGAAAGGSIATVLVALVGVRRLWRRRRWLIGLFACLFALGLFAAAMHCYPYGASCRLAQHQAPVVCLLAGQGLAVLLGRHRRATAAALVALALVGVGGICRDVWRPYRDAESLWARQLTRQVIERARQDSLVAITADEHFFPLLRWHLGRHGHPVIRDPMADWPNLAGKRSVWVLAVGLADERALVGRWRCVERSTLLSLSGASLPSARLSHWVREEK